MNMVFPVSRSSSVKDNMADVAAKSRTHASMVVMACVISSCISSLTCHRSFLGAGRSQIDCILGNFLFLSSSLKQ